MAKLSRILHDLRTQKLIKLRYVDYSLSNTLLDCTVDEWI